ncbi:short transient receptor potential channel 4-like [Athalia rosae]|uniref:short transient receptor potential channel 4-like n=1 Tax=Athalia rosae TaxID=37344 RepID=UPI0020345112|nr:short transient receptor potential channel 4-like [Athalia rosae]
MTEEKPDDLSDEIELDRRPSVLLPRLQEIEKQFFAVVATGNVVEVKNFLDGTQKFDINCVNFQGVSALHVAVEAKNKQMVEFLLSQPNIEIGDTALNAVRINEEELVVMILDSLQSMDLEFAGVMHSSDFLDGTTPLAVAAYHGHYEIIRLLIDRGHILKKPHPPNCNCDEVCKPQRATTDILTLDKMRLYLYKAVANPAYICFVTDDPILVAFELSVELKKAGEYQREFYTQYMELATLTATFATDLIGCTRTTEEVELILKQTAGLNLSTTFIYPRLLLAMDFRMKTFIAHPNIQRVIEIKWIEDWYEWKMRSVPMQVLSVPVRILGLPFIFFFLLLAPNSSRSKHWSIPVNRFLSFTATYVFFLLAVYMVSNIDKTNQLRGPPDSWFVTVIVIYVIAYTWGSLRLCLIQGPRRFFRTPWNWFEVCMLVLFMITFLFWAAAWFDVKRNGQRDLERKYWNQFDPTLIAESTYCVATIMAFLKLLFICQLDQVLGPLLLSLGRMIGDVTRFIKIFIIVIFSFTAGLARFYQYYEGMVRVDNDSKMKTQQTDSFVNFPSTLKTLFWAIFCMSPIESADVIIENLPGDSESETIINDHIVTEATGYFAFAVFQFISVIVVLNMLIACMSNTFIQVTDNVGVEWTFGRTEVYIDFMAQTTLPAPFNLCPTRTAFHTVVEFIKAWIKPTPEKRARWSLKHCCWVENIGENTKKKFPSVMSQLVQRYFREKETKVEESELDSLQTELGELRNLLQEALSSP